jgi:hypothetical protein
MPVLPRRGHEIGQTVHKLKWRELVEENRKLKQLVVDLSLDKKMLQDVLSKKL